MQQHDDCSTYRRPPGSEWKKDRESILRHFEWYDFRDSHGHQLTFCVDFLEIIDELTGRRQEGLTW